MPLPSSVSKFRRREYLSQDLGKKSGVGSRELGIGKKREMYLRELRKNKVPVRKAVLVNSAKLDWYIIKPRVPNVALRANQRYRTSIAR